MKCSPASSHKILLEVDAGRKAKTNIKDSNNTTTQKHKL